MTELKIKIKFSKFQGEIKEFSLLSDMLTEDLRLIIEEEFKIPPYKQNLIYKGKMLTDGKKIEDFNISEGDTILLVEKIGSTGEKVGLSGVAGRAGIGTPGQINYDLLKQPMGGGANIDQLIQALKIPEIAGQIDTIFDDPNVLNAMLDNPQIKAMCEMNPLMKNLITNKEFMKSIINVENLEKMKTMLEQREENPSNLNNLANLPLGNLNLFRGVNNNNLSNCNNSSNNNIPFPTFPSMPNIPMFNQLLMNMMNSRGQGNNNLFTGIQNINNNQQLTYEQLKEKYKEQSETIKGMGFSNEEDIINALKKTNGNVEAAIERLINGTK